MEDGDLRVRRKTDFSAFAGVRGCVVGDESFVQGFVVR
jgi:hypothetical protein